MLRGVGGENERKRGQLRGARGRGRRETGRRDRDGRRRMRKGLRGREMKGEVKRCGRKRGEIN